MANRGKGNQKQSPVDFFREYAGNRNPAFRHVDLGDGSLETVSAMIELLACTIPTSKDVQMKAFAAFFKKLHPELSIEAIALAAKNPQTLWPKTRGASSFIPEEEIEVKKTKRKAIEITDSDEDEVLQPKAAAFGMVLRNRKKKRVLKLESDSEESDDSWLVEDGAESESDYCEGQTDDDDDDDPRNDKCDDLPVIPDGFSLDEINKHFIYVGGGDWVPDPEKSPLSSEKNCIITYEGKVIDPGTLVICATEKKQNTYEVLSWRVADDRKTVTLACVNIADPSRNKVPIPLIDSRLYETAINTERHLDKKQKQEEKDNYALELFNIQNTNGEGDGIAHMGENAITAAIVSIGHDTFSKEHIDGILGLPALKCGLHGRCDGCGTTKYLSIQIGQYCFGVHCGIRVKAASDLRRFINKIKDKDEVPINNSTVRNFSRQYKNLIDICNIAATQRGTGKDRSDNSA